MQKTPPGDHSTLNVSPESTIPVVIDRIVVAPMGCFRWLSVFSRLSRGLNNPYSLLQAANIS